MMTIRIFHEVLVLLVLAALLGLACYGIAISTSPLRHQLPGLGNLQRFLAVFFYLILIGIGFVGAVFGTYGFYNLIVRFEKHSIQQMLARRRDRFFEPDRKGILFVFWRTDYVEDYDNPRQFHEMALACVDAENKRILVEGSRFRWIIPDEAIAHLELYEAVESYYFRGGRHTYSTYPVRLTVNTARDRDTEQITIEMIGKIQTTTPAWKSEAALLAALLPAMPEAVRESAMKEFHYFERARADEK